MLYRLGSSLILIGLILLIVFLVTYQEGNVQSSTLLAGAGLCIVGLIFHRRGRPRHQLPPRRFRAVRKFLGKINPEDE
jgi:amino acid transporter